MKQTLYKYIGQHVYNFASKFNADVEIRRTSGQPTLELSAWSATATAAHAGRIKFLKSGTAAYDTLTAGDHTTAGEILGRIEAYGVDDSDGETLAAYIEFANDAVSDADSSPGKIVLATSDADDAGEPTPRLTIDDGGIVTFNSNKISFDSVNLTAIQTSAESFVDNDTSLMTSAAIQDLCLSVGDITGVTLTADDTNTASDTAGSADFTIAGGTGASTAVSGTTLTVNVATASDSAKGIVELATTGEADTGTDTSRVVTPAGLKSHVDARYHYQYISFLGNSTVQANGDWEFPGGNGISNHTWTIDSNQSATTVGSTTISVARQYQHAGIRVPYAGKLVGIYGAGRNSAADRTFSAGLFVGVPDWGTSNSINATLRVLAAANNESGTFDNTAAKVEDLTRDFTLSAGDMIYPAIKGSGTNADTIQISMTIVIKTLIP